ncbi:hypothetical protein Tco_0701280 [Tanacetum coccineum]
MDKTLYHAWERYSDLLYRCPQHDLNSQHKVHIFNTRLDISTRRMLDSRGFIPMMTPTQAPKSIQVMAKHLHDWYDETTARGRINDISDNVDAIQASFKRAHLTKDCPLKKEDKEVEQSNPKDEGNTDDGWDITVKNVDRFRKILTPTIHILPNLKPMVQPYVPLGPVHDKEKVVREEQQDYDIPLQDGVMQSLTPQTVHIMPPDDDM